MEGDPRQGGKEVTGGAPRHWLFDIFMAYEKAPPVYAGRRSLAGDALMR